MAGRNLDLDDALAAARARYAAANPTSERLHREACRVLPGGNTRTILHFEPFPLFVDGGEGARLRDADGHDYTDFLGEYTAALFGHSHPRIRAAVHEALDAGYLLCAPTRHEAALAGLIRERFPSCERVRFTNSGTEGNLMALAAVRAHTGRSTILVFRGGYHGGVLYFKDGGSPMNAPYRFVLGEYNDLERTLAILEPHRGDLAAILVEPVMGTAGMIPADPGFLAGLREAATREGAALMLDEVMTSRVAPGGAQERYGVVPDTTTFGKYVGGGLTFGAFGGRAEIMDRFDPRRPDALPHAGTFNNNVLTLAAGVAGLRDVFTPEAARALNARGDGLRESMNALAGEHDFPARVTGLGSLLGVHFRRGPIERPADAEAVPPAARALFHLEMLERGFYVSKLGLLSLSLPLAEADYDAFLAAFEDFMETFGPLYRGLEAEGAIR